MPTTPCNPFNKDNDDGSRAKQGKEQGADKINRFRPLAFTGTTHQLFGIYFVNILLSLVTLGIWISWARVRNRRFFYGNTRALDDGFDYLATGFALFKGWILALLGTFSYFR